MPPEPRRSAQRAQNESREDKVEVLFDPSKPRSQLLDELAEQQAKQLPAINPTQLHRFFREIKNLYQRFDSLRRSNAPETAYQDHIEPLFKMVRSKAAYAAKTRGQSKVPPGFAHFLSEGIRRVQNHEHFMLFVMHLEAIVGFMYEHGKVRQGE